MHEPVVAAFEQLIVTLPMEAIVTARAVPEAARGSVKFKRIERSMEEVGIIEPLVVAPARKNLHLLLDGYLRFAILRSQGAREVRCLVATDDEAFTYNKRVNHLATIQEHLMIVRALERGVTAEKLARALNVNVSLVRSRQNMLQGICAEVIEHLKDKKVSPQAFRAMRKMKSVRQIEVADLMVAAANYSAGYAELLLAGTQKRDLLDPEKPKRVGGMSTEQVLRMEQEMASAHRNFKEMEANLRTDTFALVLASGYIGRLLRTPEIEKFLAHRHPEILDGFRTVVSSTSMQVGKDAA